MKSSKNLVNHLASPPEAAAEKGIFYVDELGKIIINSVLSQPSSQITSTLSHSSLQSPLPVHLFTGDSWCAKVATHGTPPRENQNTARQENFKKLRFLLSSPLSGFWILLLRSISIIFVVVVVVVVVVVHHHQHSVKASSSSSWVNKRH
jgi:hypothetical protein